MRPLQGLRRFAIRLVTKADRYIEAAPPLADRRALAVVRDPEILHQVPDVSSLAGALAGRLRRPLGVQAHARASLGFIFTLVQGAIVVVLIAVFGTDNRRPVSMASIVLPNALATALLAPALFQLAQRLRQGGVTRAPTEGSG